MHNFMTYGDVVFNASPRLNIILGQNGSGKVDREGAYIILVEYNRLCCVSCSW